MQNGCEPRLGQIAGALVLKEEELARLLQAAQGTLSLDGPAGDLADAEPFGARLEGRSVAKPEEVQALGPRGLPPAGPLRAGRP